MRRHGKSTSRIGNESTRRIGLLVVVGVVAVVLCSGVAAASGPDAVDLSDLAGDGSEDNPYEITNVSELQAMNQSLTANYTLANDIEAAETKQWDGGAGFEPIGNKSHEFDGTFNGSGYAILNLSIDRASSASEPVGLFGHVGTEGRLETVSLDSVDIVGQEYVGGLAGVNNGTVTGAAVSGRLVANDSDTNSYAGGLVGYNAHLVTESSSTSRVSGGSSVGGLVGYNARRTASEAGIITDSSATGDVDGAQYVGGLVGRTYNGDGITGVASEVKRSSATGNVTNSGQYTGGLVGKNDGNVTRSSATGHVEGEDTLIGGLLGANEGLVNQSYATGDAVGTDRYVGGLTAFNRGGTIVNSYATGDVVGDGILIGGLVGFNREDSTIDREGIITESYAAGAVDGNGNDDVGGLVGSEFQSTTERSYWDVEATGQTESDGVGAKYGLTTEQLIGMAGPVELQAFDFDETWRPGPTASDYPRLAWNSSFETTDDAYETVVGGDGSTATPFEVSTIYELQEMRTRLGEGEAFELQADLNLSRSSVWNNSEGFDPIGNTTTQFNGTFDGSNHTISDLTLDRSDDYVGLFGDVGSAGRIEHLTLTAMDITGNNYVGALAGRTEGTVSEVGVEGSVDGGFLVGGLVGRSASGATVTRSYSLATITGSGDQVGGAVGQNAGTVTKVTATDTVTGRSDVGGLVGNHESGGTIRESSATGTVNGSNDDIGGLVGSSQGTIANSSATGAVDGKRKIGGLVGFAGSLGTVRHSYAAGNVTGSTNVGGLVGFENGGTVDHTYWDVNESDTADGFGLGTGQATGLTTGELQGTAAAETMSALNFTTTWTVSDGYPLLRWAIGDLNLTLADDSLQVGESTAATVELTLVDTTTAAATATSSYTSNDTAVATTDGRTISATGSGTARITAKAAGIDGTAAIAVAAPPRRSRGGGGGGSAEIAAETSVTVADTGTTSTNTRWGVTVTNAQPDRPVDIRFTESSAGGDQTDGETADTDTGEPAAEAPSNIDVPSIRMNVDRGGDFTLDVTTTETPPPGGPSTDPDSDTDSGTGADTSGSTTTQSSGYSLDEFSAADRAFARETGSRSIGQVTVDHSIPDTDIREVTFTFRVRKAYLDDSDTSPDSLALYRDEPSRWNRLPTEVVGETDSQYVFEATSPGLSVFAIGSTAALFEVTDTRLGATSVDPDEPVDVVATVANRGGADGSYTVDLTANGEVVASRSVDLAAGERTTVTLAPTFATAGSYELSLGQQAVGSVAVGMPGTPDGSPVVIVVALAVLAVGAVGWWRQ